MCDCCIKCGFDHCCMVERFHLSEELSKLGQPADPLSLHCPKSHPPAIVNRARRGDRAAATAVLEMLKWAPNSSWGGVTRAEMVELASGDAEAVKARRRHKANIRAQYSRNWAKRTRWSVELDVRFYVGHSLSAHQEFTTLEEAIAWAELLVNTSGTLTQFLAEPGDDALAYDPDDNDCSFISSIDILRERLAYPWHWTFGSEYWVPKALEWEWRSEAYQQLLAMHAVSH